MRFHTEHRLELRKFLFYRIKQRSRYARAAKIPLKEIIRATATAAVNALNGNITTVQR